MHDVQAFVAAHWRPADELHGYASVASENSSRSWYAALAAAGWSVPGWPREQGGTGWSRRQHWLFERVLAESGATSPATVATLFVGPMLLAFGNARQRQLLAGIRELTEPWSVAVADLEHASVDGGRLTGAKAWVSGASTAEWFLVWSDGWWLVPRDARGLQIEPVPMMGEQLDVCRLRFEGVVVEPWQRLAGADLDWQPPPHPVAWTRAARLNRAMRSLDELAERQGGGLAEDADFRAARNSLSVAIAAVEGVEARATDAWLRGENPSALALVAALKGVETGQELSTLAARSMGYYALPYPDAMLLSNEGVIGDELALPAVQHMLFDRAWSLHTAAGAGETTEQLKNRMARDVLGLPADEPGASEV